MRKELEGIGIGGEFEQQADRFDHIFKSDLRKYFNGVFGLLVQRNGQKRD
jgi:hypothetical protein